MLADFGPSSGGRVGILGQEKKSYLRGISLVCLSCERAGQS